MSQCKFSDEFVKLCLAKSFYIANLLYISDDVHQLKDIAVCWNDCFRHRYESAKIGLLQFHCGPLELMYDLVVVVVVVY